jgi:hypothetical protein
MFRRLYQTLILPHAYLEHEHCTYFGRFRKIRSILFISKKKSINLVLLEREAWPGGVVRSTDATATTRARRSLHIPSRGPASSECLVPRSTTHARVLPASQPLAWRASCPPLAAGQSPSQLATLVRAAAAAAVVRLAHGHVSVSSRCRPSPVHISPTDPVIHEQIAGHHGRRRGVRVHVSNHPGLAAVAFRSIDSSSWAAGLRSLLGLKTCPFCSVHGILNLRNKKVGPKSQKKRCVL